MSARKPRRRIAVTSLGCKLNQAEGEAMRHRCAEAGYEIVPFGQGADVYVVNTCTVTAEADRESRRLARRARRLAPEGGRVILAGCAPQANPDGMRIPEVDLLLGNAEKIHLPDHLSVPLRRNGGEARSPEVRVAPMEDGTRFETFSLPHFEGRTRALLKVQDGCDFSCSFCATTLARGPSRSLDPEACAAQAERLVGDRHIEIVLTGIHLGAYGRDLEERTTLSRLVRRLLGVRELGRLRLSSVEPGEVTRELIRSVSAHSYENATEGGAYVCRHFHIPVQSGDDEVLSRMGRNYRAEPCANKFKEIGRRISGVCLGADFIAGFPGETDSAFERTLEWVRAVPLAYMHVFPYSPREGTEAAAMEKKLSPATVRARVRALGELGDRKWAAFVASQIGVRAEVLFERRLKDSGFLAGLTDNYIRVLANGPDDWIGRSVPLRLGPVGRNVVKEQSRTSRFEKLWGVESR